MDYVYIGKLVNTHGIKGEVRLISSFEKKDRIFKEDKHLYIGDKKECVTIKSYRTHKNFDMFTFVEYNDIIEVEKFKGEKIYANKDEIELNPGETLDTDYLSLRAVYKNKTVGYIEEIINNSGYKLFRINDKYIPFNENFIDRVDLNNKTIYLKNLEGLI